MAAVPGHPFGVRANRVKELPELRAQILHPLLAAPTSSTKPGLVGTDGAGAAVPVPLGFPAAARRGSI